MTKWTLNYVVVCVPLRMTGAGWQSNCWETQFPTNRGRAMSTPTAGPTATPRRRDRSGGTFGWLGNCVITRAGRLAPEARP